MIRFRIFCISLLVLTANFCFSQGKILIAAASDLKFAMDSLITFYEKNNPGKIEITYGSSGKLTEQIVNGAPFDIFFSADISYPEQLKSKQLTASEVYVYGIGRIVLWSKNFNARQGQVIGGCARPARLWRQYLSNCTIYLNRRSRHWRHRFVSCAFTNYEKGKWQLFSYPRGKSSTAYSGSCYFAVC
jgi:ABC-type molybdate transport system substrate-binding protein